MLRDTGNFRLFVGFFLQQPSPEHGFVWVFLQSPSRIYGFFFRGEGEFHLEDRIPNENQGFSRTSLQHPLTDYLFVWILLQNVFFFLRNSS